MSPWNLVQSEASTCVLQPIHVCWPIFMQYPFLIYSVFVYSSRPHNPCASVIFSICLLRPNLKTVSAIMDDSTMDLTKAAQNVDDSTMDLTEAVHNRNSGTNKYLISMQDNNEALLQENFELKKRIDLMEKITEHLENDISLLNIGRTKESSDLLNLQNKLDSANSRITKLESLLEDERQHLQKVIEEADRNKNREPARKCETVQDSEHIGVLTGQIHNLEMEREEKEKLIQVLLDDKDTHEHNMLELKHENQTLKDEIKEIKEHMKQKVKDLHNATLSLESLREEKLLLNTELQLLKGSDSNAARGNSLFAEVEENRLKVAAQREALKLKYLSLKKVLNQRQVENNKLKLEIVKIKREEKDDEKVIRQDYCDLIRTYKERISELEQRVQTLEQHSERSPVVISGDTNQLQWVNTILENARKEAQTLQDELERRSSHYVAQGHQLFDSQKENRRLKATTLKLNAEIDELRLQLDIIKKANENVDDGISPPATDIAIAYQKQKTVTFKETIEHRNTSLGEKSINKSNGSFSGSILEDKENRF